MSEEFKLVMPATILTAALPFGTVRRMARAASDAARVSAAAAFVVAVYGFGAAPAMAQGQPASMEERLRTQLRATTVQLQQVQNELAALKAAGANGVNGVNGAPPAAKPEASKESAAQVESLRRELSQARAALAQEREARAQHDQQSGEARKTAQEAVERSSTQVGQFRDAYNEVLRVARTSEAERTRLAAGVQWQEQALQQCDLKNRELYRVGQEILETYETLDTRKVLESRHLFAAKARVKYDEIAQRFGDQLYAAKFDPANPLGQQAQQQAQQQGQQAPPESQPPAP